MLATTSTPCSRTRSKTRAPTRSLYSVSVFFFFASCGWMTRERYALWALCRQWNRVSALVNTPCVREVWHLYHGDKGSRGVYRGRSYFILFRFRLGCPSRNVFQRTSGEFWGKLPCVPDARNLAQSPGGTYIEKKEKGVDELSG